MDEEGFSPGSSADILRTGCSNAQETPTKLLTTRAKKIDGPSDPVKLDVLLMKQQVNNLPVFCRLPKFDGKHVKLWASFEGCSEKQWRSAFTLFKGMQVRNDGLD
ncbi:hypothetical protein Vretimale_7627 [Volvox reticuliferus]|uniref:Uncharacterized protein n=1 Tax=Volvox reticuliferus TaxID=1737510 RepID=A0A8J4LMX4_9CHLO|nr:hypothetical protein Vretifemale_7673 [Volvox reticuliferus]GIM02776.1 hypothetical protein Vretimale_7627 [Volvox reticuliferus]